MSKKNGEELSEADKKILDAHRKADSYENQAQIYKNKSNELEQEIAKKQVELDNIKDSLKKETEDHYRLIEAKKKDLDTLLKKAQEEISSHRVEIKALEDDKKAFEKYSSDSFKEIENNKKRLSSQIEEYKIYALLNEIQINLMSIY